MQACSLTESGQGGGKIFVNVDPDGLGPAGFGDRVFVTQTHVGGFDFIPAQPDRSIDAEVGLAWDRTGGPHAGRVYMVNTAEQPNESDNTDIYVRHSDDNGATWSAGVRVNDDSTRQQPVPAEDLVGSHDRQPRRRLVRQPQRPRCWRPGRHRRDRER
jgi:hypothetical protein